MPYNDQISALIHDDIFRSIIDGRLFDMLKYVIRLGNNAVHTNKRISRDDAVLSLKDLFEFCDWIDYSYSRNYEPHTFDESLVPLTKMVLKVALWRHWQKRSITLRPLSAESSKPATISQMRNM